MSRMAESVSTEQNHPYREFEISPIWNVVESAVKALEENQDLKITTTREYVIGYLCRELFRNKVVSFEAP